MRRLKLFAPLAAFLLLAVFLFRGLSLDPTALPSARVGQPLPAFSLPELASGEMLSPASLAGKPALLNVWATWCYSCRVEHPYLLQLAEQGVTIYGLNYKDEDAKASAWLKQLGDPYRQTIVDAEGTLGLDLGVYGAPETYVVDAEGVVRYRHVGVVNEQVWNDVLASYFEESP
ncbi:MAG: DsbE family thiol:disulfide interchange protein [Halieaceae bacterium]|jgi:cytochrome c biogenesis protein CcmG/thiol:disulfide interchange protein DsbE|nr:DsbE family thiol:disulfide interchange protein [Halieaceae bacterium]